MKMNPAPNDEIVAPKKKHYNCYKIAKMEGRPETKLLFAAKEMRIGSRNSLCSAINNLTA